MLKEGHHHSAFILPITGSKRETRVVFNLQQLQVLGHGGKNGEGAAWGLQGLETPLPPRWIRPRQGSHCGPSSPTWVAAWCATPAGSGSPPTAPLPRPPRRSCCAQFKCSNLSMITQGQQGRKLLLIELVSRAYLIVFGLFSRYCAFMKYCTCKPQLLFPPYTRRF